MFRIDNKIAQNTNLWSLNDSGELEFSYKDDILSEYQSLFKTIFGDINTDPSTPQGQIITSLTQIDLATISYLENLANAFFFGGSGDFLDKWAWNLYRVVRKNGTASSVMITITGEPSTDIPADFIVSDGSENYIIEAPTRIGENGEILAKFNNVNINDYVAKANTITQIVTNIDGVERVNNDSNAIPAILRETDAELFNRCLYFGSTATNASFRSILANVAQVKGVNRLAGAENVLNTAQTINGVELTPHSICIVVDGGDDEAIAKAIQDSKATGCDMVGDIEIPLYIDKQKYIYRFYRPTQVALQAQVTISEANTAYIRSDFEKITKDALSNFINHLDIAKTITQPLLSNALIKIVGSDFNIDDLQFSKKSESLAYSPINLKLNEIATISLDDIEVIKV
ncbi:baseplate J/gp47 family protein [Campylobacter lanienae]|uniref:baseplate J/gp47 family protein n=1 Tax=Campylobacter lanienae TaxID=75658 RepID=UPI00243031F6|nr:baseplate J/gp47 family protein [Campylobacter lanienae]MDD5786038.1 baseplate J/gp47 family protein [Campylobacter lanienae]